MDGYALDEEEVEGGKPGVRLSGRSAEPQFTGHGHGRGALGAIREPCLHGIVRYVGDGL